METYKIKVLLQSFPGYGPILEWYNANKPNEWQAIRKAGIAEGGFEVPLTKAELEIMQEKYERLEPDQYVRQLEWHRGELRQHHNYATLWEEETLLLGKALQTVLGDENVEVSNTNELTQTPQTPHINYINIANKLYKNNTNITYNTNMIYKHHA